MRPRRDFIVEIKSSRRLQKPQGRSIWGDTDLQAIKREVEYEAPHIFDGTISEEARPATRQAEGSLVARTPGDDISAPTVLTVVDVPMSELSNDLSVEIGGTDALAKSDSIPVVKKRPTTSKSPLARKRSQQIAEVNGSDLLAELTELESENRRLKLLWRSRLEAENREIKRMLARFSVT